MPILQWLDRDKTIKQAGRVPYRLLEMDTNLSYGDKNSQNMLIQGDNLEALKALLPYYAGKVKCIYIDPPYNTGSAFEHYDDNLEHSKWLDMMYPRLELLRKLLAEDGSAWVSIDADESHYLKVIMDEVFGRKNFIDEIVWQRSYAPINLKKTLSRSHDTILVYAKNSEGFEFNKLPRSDEANNRYKNPDNDPRGDWKSDNLSVGPAVEKNVYEITTPSGRKVMPPSGYSWRLSRERFEEFVGDNRIWFGSKGGSVPSIKRFLSEVKDGVTAMTVCHEYKGEFYEAKIII
jgi:adenine-specific DNA-methyltransferase